MSNECETAEVRHCPLCGEQASRAEYTSLHDDRCGVPGSWAFLGCLGCGAIYGSPRLRDPRHAYPRGYEQHAPRPLANVSPSRAARRFVRTLLLAQYGYGERLSLPRRLAARLLGSFGPIRRRAFFGTHSLPPGPPGRLLDVGCGNGWLLHLAQALGWRAEGVEPDDASAAIARQWGIVHASLDDATGPYDAITLTHSLEHMTDPRRTLERCAELLAPGGRLVVVVPNWRSLQHRWFGHLWRALEPSRHLVMFDPEVLAALLRECGYDVERLSTTSSGSAQYWFPEHWRLRFGHEPSLLVRRLLFPALCSGIDFFFRARGDEIIAHARIRRGAAGSPVPESTA